MTDVCDNCKRQYSVVYRVPNEIWSKIAPNKETLGKFPEHQYGGLLCPDCASDAAAKAGFRLIFCAEVFEPESAAPGPQPTVQIAGGMI